MPTAPPRAIVGRKDDENIPGCSVLTCRLHWIAAIEENETLAQSLGLVVWRYKVLGFVVAAGLAGMAGFSLVNMLILRGLLHYYSYYGNDFLIECPTGSGRKMNLYQVAEEIGRRLASIFLRDARGRRPVYGGARKFQDDPHWRDYVLFYEYFHGDNGAGLGASHQTGWTGLIARSMQLFATMSAEQFLERGKRPDVTTEEAA